MTARAIKWAHEWRRMPRDSGSLVVSNRSEICPSSGSNVVGADQLPIHLGGNGGLSQTRPNFGGNIDRANAVRELQSGSVGQNNFEHDLSCAWVGSAAFECGIATKDAAANFLTVSSLQV